MKRLIKRLFLYGWTLRYLKPRQLVYLIWRRIQPATYIDIRYKIIQTRAGTRHAVVFTHQPPVIDSDKFTFLNVSKVFEHGNVDWVSADMPKLWRYNLHYFDFLHQPGRSDKDLDHLINHWLVHNPMGSADAWEPYTVSLRMVNWIKYFLAKPGGAPDLVAWQQSLYVHALWLEKHIEYQLLANHYLKNAKALFYAGMYFDGDDAERWLYTGVRILSEEAQQQILADGGHIERSPMYHCITVADYLDIIDLIQNSHASIATSTRQLFRDKTVAALDFLSRISLPDGQIPLFNDAAFGIAPTPEQLFAYATKVISYQPPEKQMTVEACALAASGYYVIRDHDHMMVIDCGPVGPDYQPGHAHCDTLSYELCIGGQRLVVDTGVYSYENSANRHYSRSTGAHNTVRIDAQEQSEIWGVFRVARRARPIMASLISHPDGWIEFTGAHDGYLRLAGHMVHTRTVRYHPAQGWHISDMITGSGTHHLESFIHLHPAIRVDLVAQGVRLVMPQGQVLLFIPEGKCEVIVLSTSWYPEFGCALPNTTLRLSCIRTLPSQFGYAIVNA